MLHCISPFTGKKPYSEELYGDYYYYYHYYYYYYHYYYYRHHHHRQMYSQYVQYVLNVSFFPTLNEWTFLLGRGKGCSLLISGRYVLPRASNPDPDFRSGKHSSIPHFKRNPGICKAMIHGRISVHIKKQLLTVQRLFAKTISFSTQAKCIVYSRPNRPEN